MRSKKLFNRTEFSGSLGDIGTLLPIATGMILINQLNPLGVFFSIGLYYLFSGLYFKVPVPVQPMKLIGTYAIAMGLSIFTRYYKSGNRHRAIYPKVSCSWCSTFYGCPVTQSGIEAGDRDIAVSKNSANGRTLFKSKRYRSTSDTYRDSNGDHGCRAHFIVDQ